MSSLPLEGDDRIAAVVPSASSQFKHLVYTRNGRIMLVDYTGGPRQPLVVEVEPRQPRPDPPASPRNLGVEA